MKYTTTQATSSDTKCVASAYITRAILEERLLPIERRITELLQKQKPSLLERIWSFIFRS